MHPKVSIVLPVYNRSHLLKRSIQSVLNQSYDDFELIVVDDGSTQELLSIVEDFKDKRIVYIKQTRNLGPAAARNTGIKRARGEYIAFQDSDDVWLPHKLFIQMQTFDVCKGVCCVFSRAQRLEPKYSFSLPHENFYMNQKLFLNGLLTCDFIATPAVVVRKSCFEEQGLFDESMNSQEDWDMWIRLAKVYQFQYIPITLVNSYVESDAISKHTAELSKTYKKLYNKNKIEYQKNKRIYSSFCAHAGDMLHTHGETREAKEYFLRSIKAWPKNIKAWFVLFCCLLGDKAYGFIKDRYYGFLYKKNLICGSLSVLKKDLKCLHSIKHYWYYLLSRRRIKRFVKTQTKQSELVKVELGAAARNKTGWLTLDLKGADVVADIRHPLPFADNTVDFFYMSHVLEHFSFKEIQKILGEILRTLKPKGELRIVVPDASIYINSYIDDVKFDQRKYFTHWEAVNFFSKVDNINYIAFMDGAHKHMFDERALLNVLECMSFVNVKKTGFDSSIDLTAREYESIYVCCQKADIGFVEG